MMTSLMEMNRMDDKEIERIAELTKKKLVKGIYEEIGKGVLKRVVWTMVIILLAISFVGWDFIADLWQ